MKIQHPDQPLIYFVLSVITAIIIVMSIVSISNFFYTQPDYVCGIDTCTYYNESAYYKWCDTYYGSGNWVMVKNVNTGLGGIFLSDGAFELGTDSACQPKRNISTTLVGKDVIQLLNNTQIDPIELPVVSQTKRNTSP